MVLLFTALMLRSR
jgi:predicted short-subunit dehydrogenase-like oxidoreductase (DUF2520 family)